MSLENDLNNLNRDKFISLFGAIFEKTQWIAEKLLEHKPFKNKGNAVFGLYNSKSICPVILSKPFTTEPTPFDNCILFIQLPGV